MLEHFGNLTLCLSSVASIFLSLVFVKKKNTTNGKEACESKFLITVDGFARFSLAKSLEYLPVHSRLLNCDLL